MIKKNCFSKRMMALILASVVMLSGIPVGAADFGAQENITGAEDNISSEADTQSESDTASEAEGFGDGSPAEAFTAQEETETFQDGTSGTGENTEGIQYIKGRPLTPEEEAEQLAPFKNLTMLETPISIGSDVSVIPYGMATSFPTKYDSRDSGIVTPVKFQDPFGMCWSFAMAATMETSLLKAGMGTYDLSEEHLAYFFANRQNDPLGNTAGDANIFAIDYHEGGNNFLASLFLSTWSGMTTETDVPLPTEDHYYDTGIRPDASKAYNTSAYLENACFSDYSTERMKSMVQTYGAVSIAYLAYEDYYNASTAASSCPINDGTNHAVTVVGWDDTYSKSNFNSVSNVQNDGAWIVKNSWDTDWGNQGYFYLSYEDATISYLVSTQAVNATDYPNNYFYDGSSVVCSDTMSPGDSMANVFTTKSGKDEVLGEVVTTALSDNSTYSIQIYTNLTDPSNPSSGTPAYATPVTATQAMAGVQTIRIPEVTLPANSTYSVVITNAGASSIQYAAEMTFDNIWVLFHASVLPNQGFRREEDGSWTDLEAEGCTPRIKAHTRTLSTAPTPTVTPTPPPTPTGLKATAKTYNTISLYWTASEGVNYSIRRKASGESTKEVGTVENGASTYSDKTVKTGISYTYTVRPYLLIDGEKLYGMTSASATASTVLSVPAFEVKASSGMYNAITWKKVSGAHGYRIYRKTPSGSWQTLGIVDKAVLSYKDHTAETLTSYQYTVRAYRTVNGKAKYSKYTAGAVIKTSAATQKVSSVASGTTGIKIRWTAQKASDGYQIYRKVKGGSWESLKTLSGGSASSYVDKTAVKGKTYTYAVRAYVTEPYGKLYSRYQSSAFVKCKY